MQTAADQRTDYYLGTYIFLGTGATVTIMGETVRTALAARPAAANITTQTAACGPMIYLLAGLVVWTAPCAGFLGCCGAWKESPWMLGSVRRCCSGSTVL